MKTPRIKRAEIVGIHAAVSRAATELAEGGCVATVQQALSNALAIIGPRAMDPRERAKLNGAAGGRKPVHLYEYRGEQKTSLELAALAGCTPEAMRGRLKTYPPEVAVDMGTADRARRKEGWVHPCARTYTLDGEQFTVARLAEKAGCKENTMRGRLKTMEPDKAVAMGAGDVKRARPNSGNRTPRGKALSLRDDKPAAPPACLKPAAPSGPIVMLPGVEIQRAAPIPDRFAVDPAKCPPIFGGRRIGQYEDTGTAIARQYGA